MEYTFEAVYDSPQAPGRRLLLRVLKTRRDDIVRRHVQSMQPTSVFMVNYYCAVRVDTLPAQVQDLPHYSITLSIAQGMLEQLGVVHGLHGDVYGLDGLSQTGQLDAHDDGHEEAEVLGGVTPLKPHLGQQGQLGQPGQPGQKWSQRARRSRKALSPDELHMRAVLWEERRRLESIEVVRQRLDVLLSSGHM